MSDLSINFASAEVLTAANLNQVLQELEGFTRGITSAQLLGAITADKLADNSALTFMQLPILPFTSGASIASPAGFVLPAAWARVCPIVRPAIRPGWECDLCAIFIHVQVYDQGGTDQPQIRFRRNGTTTLGAAEITLTTSDNVYTIAYPDPIANPVSPAADGDYFEVQMQGPTGTPEPRGISATIAWKHTLVAG